MAARRAVKAHDELLPISHYAVLDQDKRLYNEDLAPVPPSSRRWGSFAIFNVWTNDVQSLAGYTLAASLFITAGISGWAGSQRSSSRESSSWGWWGSPDGRVCATAFPMP